MNDNVDLKTEKALAWDYRARLDELNTINGMLYITQQMIKELCKDTKLESDLVHTSFMVEGVSRLLTNTILEMSKLVAEVDNEKYN